MAKQPVTIDQFITAQAEAPAHRLNEDAIVVVENDAIGVVAVLDGATARSAVTGQASGGGGAFATQAAGRGVQRHYASAASAAALLLAANQVIASAYRALGVDPQIVSPLELSRVGGATLARLDKQRGVLEIAQVGDSAGLVVSLDGSVELALPLDPEPFDGTAIELAQQIVSQTGTKLIAAFKDPRIAALMEKGQLADNAPDGSGSGVLNGNANVARYLKMRQWPLDQVRQVVLLTDGLWLPTEQFGAEPDWQRIVALIDQEGLAGLYRTVLTLKNGDPDLVSYPRWKKHDDASGVVITLSGT